MSPPVFIDGPLIEASLRGDTRAFGSLVQRYQALLRSVAFGAVSDPALSEDIAQEALVTAYCRLRELRDHTRFRAWLCGIVRNEARYWRRHHRRHAPQGASLDAACHAVPCQQPTPADAAMSAQQTALVREALSRLPGRYREPLVLYYRESRSVRQIADDLELTEAAVKQRLTRGRRHLSRELTEFLSHSLGDSRVRGSLGVAVVSAIAARQQPAFAAAATGANLATLWPAAVALAATCTLALIPAASPAARPLALTAPTTAAPALAAPAAASPQESPPHALADPPLGRSPSKQREPAPLPPPRGIVYEGIASVQHADPSATPTITLQSIAAPLAHRSSQLPSLLTMRPLRFMHKLDDIE